MGTINQDHGAAGTELKITSANRKVVFIVLLDQALKYYSSQIIMGETFKEP